MFVRIILCVGFLFNRFVWTLAKFVKECEKYLFWITFQQITFKCQKLVKKSKMKVTFLLHRGVFILSIR